MPSRKELLSEPDQWVGTANIGRQADISEEHARQLMLRGEFGDMADVSMQGSKRPSWRVRQSAVDAWLTSRRVTR